jgi:hypothetical protein
MFMSVGPVAGFIGQGIGLVIAFKSALSSRARVLRRNVVFTGIVAWNFIKPLPGPGIKSPVFNAPCF